MGHLTETGRINVSALKWVPDGLILMIPLSQRCLDTLTPACTVAHWLRIRAVEPDTQLVNKPVPLSKGYHSSSSLSPSSHPQFHPFHPLPPNRFWVMSQTTSVLGDLSQRAPRLAADLGSLKSFLEASQTLLSIIQTLTASEIQRDSKKV